MPGMFLGRGMGGLMSSGAAVAAGWWVVAGKTCVASWKPKGAASLAASYVNLANPGTYDAAPGTAPALDANGWVFNGATNSRYLTTGIVPASGWSMIAKYSSTSAITGNILAGSFVTNGAFCFAPNDAGPVKDFYYGNKITNPTGGSTAGVIAMTSEAGYIDGLSVVSLAGFTFSATAPAIYIGAINYSTKYFFIGTIEAIAIYSDTLTAAQVATLSSTIAAL